MTALPTIVTAVYNIGRERIDGRSIKDYKIWIVKTLQAIHAPFIVYLDPILGWKQELLDIRPSITVIEIPFTELGMYKYKDHVARILQNPGFTQHIPHPNDITNKLPEYCILQYNKFFFVEDAMQRNIYQSRQFAWMDAGFSRFFPSESGVYTLKSMPENTFHVQGYFTQPLLESITYDNYIGSNFRIFQGGLWMTTPAEFMEAKAEIMRVWETEMMAKLRLDNEQIAMVYAYKHNPKIFTVHLQMNSMTHLFCEMFQEYTPPKKDQATVVTSYYRIPSKHPHTHYEEWIANFMRLTMNVIIFVDMESLNFLIARYPESPTRKYKLREFRDFRTSKYNWEKEVAKNTKPHPGHNACLFQLWAEKFYFVEEAMGWNPYSTDAFVWMDIGCVRSADCIARMEGFPDVSKFDSTRVNFLQIEPWLPTDVEQAKTLTDAQFYKRNPLGGTLFAGGKDALRAFIPVYTEVLDEADRLGVFKGEDQYLYAFCALRRPDLVCLVQPPNTDYDIWFSLQIVWSANPPLRIVLVGPGIMPIPPTGWGACEILIWDMAKTLRKQGHDITILNTKDMSAVIAEIMDRKPDFVHIQYDDYAYIAGLIAPYTKGVAITSHYGYLDQKYRWGGYENTFRLAIGHTQPNIYHFALSESIKNVYLQHGVNPAYVYVVPNGADDTLFRYTPTPKYPERSIVVGKVEVRKGQYKLMNVDNVWFAGNRGDGSFDYRHPRWLGEWSKPVLYDSLTDYGNLVLLSDGEADPLVVKEAFTAGLGVVVSGWASANLDITKPFITVIPNDRLNDISYIAERIGDNRRISSTMRGAIREYSAQFAWPKLMEEYTKRIHSLMKGSECRANQSLVSTATKKIKVLHISHHVGCMRDHAYIYETLNFDYSFWKFPKGLFYITKDVANTIWRDKKDYFNSFDYIVTSDTAPLARIFMENIDEVKPNIIVWICNRYDYNMEPDHSFYELFAGVHVNNADKFTIIPFSDFEGIYYANKQKQLLYHPTITPIGINKQELDIHIDCLKELETSYTKDPNAKDSYKNVDEITDKIFIPIYGNDNRFFKLKEMLEINGIQCFNGGFKHPDDLRGCKAYVTFPDAFSKLITFETIQHEIIVFLPSERFLINLNPTTNNGTQYWFNNPFGYLDLETVKLCEWYRYEKCRIYFDSIEDLVSKIKHLSKETVEEKKLWCRIYGKEIEKTNMKLWRNVFRV